MGSFFGVEAGESAAVAPGVGGGVADTSGAGEAAIDEGGIPGVSIGSTAFSEAMYSRFTDSARRISASSNGVGRLAGEVDGAGSEVAGSAIVGVSTFEGTVEVAVTVVDGGAGDADETDTFAAGATGAGRSSPAG